MAKSDYDTTDLRQMDVTHDYDDNTTIYGISRREHMLLYSIVAFFVIAVIWAYFTELDEVTRGQGKVIPSSEVQVIQNLEGGIVEEFLVTEGDTVQKDQVILKMRNVQAKSEYAANRKRYLGLLATVVRLKAEADGEAEPTFPESLIKEAKDSVQTERAAFKANKRETENQRNVLDQQLSQRQQEVRELTRRISDLSKIIKLSKNEYEMIKVAVSKGAAPKMESLQLERQIAEQQSELNGLRLSLPRTRSSVKEAEQRIQEQKSAFRANAQRELGERKLELESLKETLSAYKDREERTEVRSPVYGTVKDMKIKTVGGVVRPGDPIMEIVPLKDNLLIEAQVKPSDIAFIHPGLEAVVKVTALDYSIYGGLEGKVVDISADTIIEPDTGESFYRVKVRTEETQLTRRGETHDIIPGMVVSVDILTGKKSIMDYLVKPFVKASKNALRER